jgi:hypothetical protein
MHRRTEIIDQSDLPMGYFASAKERKKASKVA